MDGSVEVPASFHSSSPRLLSSLSPSLASSATDVPPSLCMFLELLFHTPSNIWVHGRWRLNLRTHTVLCIHLTGVHLTKRLIKPSPRGSPAPWRFPCPVPQERALSVFCFVFCHQFVFNQSEELNSSFLSHFCNRLPTSQPIRESFYF